MIPQKQRAEEHLLASTEKGRLHVRAVEIYAHAIMA